jgi:hypothetical protein
MCCSTCEKFPVPTGKFEEIADSMLRHGTLYRCKVCGGFIELIEEERSARFLSRSQAAVFYPQATLL